MAELRAVTCGSRLVFLELQPQADGTYTLVGSEFLRIVESDQRSGQHVIRASVVGNRMRFRDHEDHCKQKQITHEAMQATRPTGVWNRDRKP